MANQGGRGELGRSGLEIRFCESSFQGACAMVNDFGG